nr:Down syndrome critical region protein 4 [Pan paniscus]
MSLIILTRDDKPRIFTPDSDAVSPALHSTSPLPDPASASPLHREEKILPKVCNIVSCLSFSLPASPTDSGLASPTIITREGQQFWAKCLIWKYQLYLHGLHKKSDGRRDKQISASPST